MDILINVENNSFARDLKLHIATAMAHYFPQYSGTKKYTLRALVVKYVVCNSLTVKRLLIKAPDSEILNSKTVTRVVRI